MVIVLRNGKNFLEVDDETLARGNATGFKKSTLPAFLEYWEKLANQQGEKPPCPEKPLRGEILTWAESALTASYAKEGTNCPDAFVKEEGSRLLFGWDGTFIPGRKFRLAVDFNKKGNRVSSISINWDTATGKPSHFLGIEKLFGLLG